VLPVTRYLKQKKELPCVAAQDSSGLKPNSTMKTRKRIQGEIGTIIIALSP
jgi:hypothetical protein